MLNEKPSLRRDCLNRWDDILPLFGIDRKYLKKRHGPCPVCGGVDRFRYQNNNGTGNFICSSCGPGEGIKLLLLYTERPFAELAREIRNNLGKTKMTEPKPEYNNYQENESVIRSILKTCKKLRPDSVVARYLAGRGITVLPETNVYESYGIPFNEGKPAMVGCYRFPDGSLATISVSMLTGDQQVTRTSRKFMPVVKPMAGSSIKMFESRAPICAVCEGIETGLAIHMRDGIQVYVAGSANGMEKIELPEYITDVWIYADMDANFVGQKAAYTLAERLRRGKPGKDNTTVRVVTLPQRNFVVDEGDKYDFLDYVILTDYERRVREADPDQADFFHKINQKFGTSAAAVKVGDEVVARVGHFEPTKQEVKDCATFRAKQSQSDSERL
jgi:putative DNA primase/helicase